MSNDQNSFLPQMEPWFGQEEKDKIIEYLDEGGWFTEFRKTQEFEAKIAEYIKAKHCIAVNNGTISLTLATLACSIGPGDEVIVPNYTMIATPNSVKMIGATPVFVDVEPETLCMDLSLAEAAITSKTKAIMLVSANGRYPLRDISEFTDLCKKHDIVLIEDSAQSLGSFYPDGRHIGTAGVIGSFSFSAPKIISTGQGGALFTDDDEIADSLRKLKDFGRSGGGNDIHDSIGFNFKFTELQACVGLAQMEKLQWRVDRKKEILRLYIEGLADVKQVTFFKQNLDHTTPWFIDVLAEDRDSLLQHLKDNNIGSRLMYSPINQQKAYQLPGSYPVSEMVGEKGLWLPSASQLSDEQIAVICDAIASFYG